MELLSEKQNGSFDPWIVNPGQSVQTNGESHFEKILLSHFSTVWYYLHVKDRSISSNSFFEIFTTVRL